jgi:hypothetical protein
MAVTQKPTIDFTLMYATHVAFRRDVERMLSAAVAGTAHDPRVRAGWDNFKTQLLLHHTVEDTHLWPRLRQAVAGQPDDVALVDDMEAEHALIDPVLADLDDALAGDPGSLAGHVRQLAATLDDHLTHQEDAALPLIQAALTARAGGPSAPRCAGSRVSPEPPCTCRRSSTATPGHSSTGSLPRCPRRSRCSTA